MLPNKRVFVFLKVLATAHHDNMTYDGDLGRTASVPTSGDIRPRLQEGLETRGQPRGQYEMEAQSKPCPGRLPWLAVPCAYCHGPEGVMRTMTTTPRQEAGNGTKPGGHQHYIPVSNSQGSRILNLNLAIEMVMKVCVFLSQQGDRTYFLECNKLLA